MIVLDANQDSEMIKEYGKVDRTERRRHTYII